MCTELSRPGLTVPGCWNCASWLTAAWEIHRFTEFEEKAASRQVCLLTGFGWRHRQRVYRGTSCPGTVKHTSPAYAFIVTWTTDELTSQTTINSTKQHCCWPGRAARDREAFWRSFSYIGFGGHVEIIWTLSVRCVEGPVCCYWSDWQGQ